jgi:hypothetical protein
MKKYGPQLWMCLLVLPAAFTLACGTSSTTPSSQSRTPSSQRQIKSISISPATADAKDYPGGQVQFTAVANFSEPPSPVSISPTWEVCTDNGTTNGPSEITVNQSGVAECNPGASGTYIVDAYDYQYAELTCNLLLSCADAGTDCYGTHGIAKLTCP